MDSLNKYWDQPGTSFRSLDYGRCYAERAYSPVEWQSGPAPSGMSVGCSRKRVGAREPQLWGRDEVSAVSRPAAEPRGGGGDESQPEGA